MNPVEVQLFYIDDDQPVVVQNQNVDKTAMLQCCVSAIRRKNPSAEISLVTNSRTKIHLGVEGIKVIETDTINHSTLIYDLNVFRRNYISEKKHLNKRVLFTDIDVLINCDLSLLFEGDFDIKTAIWTSCPYVMTDKGLPTTQPYMFQFTGGGFFVNCNDRSLSFFDRYLEFWEELYESDDFTSYGQYGPSIKQNFFKWWGELHTFCLMVGTEVLSGREKKKVISSCEFNFLDESDYNYAPNCDKLYQLDDITLKGIEIRDLAAHLKYKKIIHFRGRRKEYMTAVFSQLNALP